MRTSLWIEAIAAMGLMVTQGALAQVESGPADQSTGVGVQRETRPGATPPYNPSQTNSQLQAGQQKRAPGELVRVRELIAANVQSQDGKKIGKIEEVIVDGSAQRIQFAVLGKGGVLGIGEQFRPVPWQALSLPSGQREYVLNVNEQKLALAPRLLKGHYEDLDRVEFTSQVYEFYGVQPEGVGAPSSRGEPQKGQDQGQLPDQQKKTD